MRLKVFSGHVAEIELLVGADDVDVAYFPTTRIHALAAVEEAFT